MILALKAKLGGGSEPSGPGNVYELRTAILTKAERSFFGALEQACPEGVGLLAKVRLGDVFKPRQGLSPSERTGADNRINRKHVDFLLVRVSDLAPLAGVELDDSSHERSDRQKRDAFVDDVFQSCGLPLLHVPAQASYNVADLRAAVAGALEAPAGAAEAKN
ncbi:MAG: DUF2726 domain-containing protein [Opitutaceae bacterium]